MEKEVINPRGAPLPVGSYSPIIKLDKLIYSSGQIALDPVTNQLVPGGVVEQMKKVMGNIRVLLEESDSSFDQVLKMTLYLINMGDFKEINAIYESYFHGSFPARSTIEVKALPLGALIEIDFIAHSA